MKTTGEITLIEKLGEKSMYFLRIREYNREGNFNQAELYCRLTNTAKEQLNTLKEFLVFSEGEQLEIPIKIKDSFYAVDNYYKGEVKYTKPTLVICDLELGE